MELLRLAAYIDEAHDDPIEAINVIKKCGINYTALRTAWNTQIHLLNDTLLSSLRNSLNIAGIAPILIYCDVGNVGSSLLTNISDSEIERVMQVASYFRVNLVRFGIGMPEKYKNSVGIKNDNQDLERWFKRVQDLALQYSVVPLAEVRSNDLQIERLKRFIKWKLIFDPASLVMSASVDVYDKYYHSIRHNISVLEIHDYKTGYGHKPSGFGDAQIKKIVEDCEGRNYDGWYILKHSLGRKYSSYKARHEVFEMAKKALDTVLET